MQLDWDKLFRRYVLDDVKTPYFVAVGRLTQTQARYELFVYTVFMAVLFGVVGVAALSTELPHGNAHSVPVYALSVVGAAAVFGMTKYPWAAAYCASAPIAAFLYFALFGFHPNLGPWDKTLLIVVVLLWLRYSWRVLTIVRAIPTCRPDRRTARSAAWTLSAPRDLSKPRPRMHAELLAAPQPGGWCAPFPGTCAHSWQQTSCSRSPMCSPEGIGGRFGRWSRPASFWEFTTCSTRPQQSTTFGSRSASRS